MTWRLVLGVSGTTLAIAALVVGVAAAPPSVRAENAQARPASGCNLDISRADVAAARATLLAEPEPENLETDVTPGTKTALGRYKDAIAALVAARMECAAAGEDPDAVADALDRATAPVDCDACRDRAYAAPLVFRGRGSDDARHLLALTATLPIPCGSDDMLFVYRHDGAHWREILRWQAPPYDRISGAYGSFEYDIAPPDAHGDWYVAVKDVPPWCTSTWSSVRYAAMRASSDPMRPKILYRGNDAMWWGNDDWGRVTADADAFEVRFHSSSIDAGAHNRVWVRRFAVSSDAVSRIPPLAENARDFVDEWLISRWRDVSKWSSDDAVAALQTWHARLRGGEGNDHASGEFKSVHACDGRSDAVEVEIAMDTDDVDYFLRVEGTPDTFRLTHVGTESDPGCGGEDLLRGMTDTHAL